MKLSMQVDAVGLNQILKDFLRSGQFKNAIELCDVGQIGHDNVKKILVIDQ